jgi:uncharacterized repeat protein (TIGR01451 family)
MSSKLNVFSYIPKQVLIVLGVVLALIATSFAYASFSPGRPTFTMENPASYVTFNSITNNPSYGDERYFHDVKKAGTPNGTPYSDNYEVKNGDEIVLRAYVHNNAKASLNASGVGVAKGTKIRFLVPTGMSNNLRTISYVMADNAQPKMVSDTADLFSSKAFGLEYVPGSAMQYTNSNTAGIKLSDSVVTEAGATIGDTTANGNYRGCSEFVSTVHIRVKVKMPDYEVQKQVRLEGQDKSAWTEKVTAQPGSTVEWKINFTNNGNTKLNDVVIGDQLPKDMTIVPGSTMIYNSNHPQGIAAGSDNVVSGGINIGNYNPASNGIVVFKAKVPAVDKIKCGVNNLVNTGFARPGNMNTVNDKASVDVNRECEPTNEFIRCEMLNLSIIDKNTRTVEASVDVRKSDGIEVTGYEFNWGDGNTDEVENNTARHSYEAEGKYRVVATVKYEENGTAKSVNCESEVDFVKNTVTPVTPTTPTPTTPTTLPNTGPGEIFASLFGTGALAGATHMWVNSRRALKAKLLA